MKNVKSQKKKFHVRRGDLVRVITGDDRGKTGQILQVITKKDRVIVEGVNLIKKATRPSQNNPKGGILEKEGSIHISNVKRVTKEESASSKSSK